MHDMMSVILEDVLDEELGYSKYDYRNKDTDNSRNGYSKKTMHTSYGDMDVAIPRNRNSEYELQLIKKYPNTVKKDMGKMLSTEIFFSCHGFFHYHVNSAMVTVIIMEFMPFYPFAFQKKTAPVFLKLYVIKTHRFSSINSVIRIFNSFSINSIIISLYLY